VRYERFVLNTHGLSEDEAYQRLRAKAMVNREVIEEVAQAIVKAHDVLSL
jgi:AmiR/NasT family two-component response regulator